MGWLTAEWRNKRSCFPNQTKFTLRRQVVPCSLSFNHPSLHTFLVFCPLTCSFLCVTVFTAHRTVPESYNWHSTSVYWICDHIHSFTSWPVKHYVSIFFILDIFVAPKYVKSICTKTNNYRVRVCSNCSLAGCTQGFMSRVERHLNQTKCVGEESCMGERWESVKASLSWELKENHRPHKCS